LIPSLPIEVHLISHSHDDLGWYKTAQEYYEGGGNDFFNYCVRDIITNVVEELIKDTSKTFVQVNFTCFY
jgi:lysosomal alpha-mannosidase